MSAQNGHFRVRDIPWIWSEVLHPQDKFIAGPLEVPDDGWLWAWIDPDVLSLRLEQAYEREVRRELIEAEWPSAYWDAVNERLEAVK